MPSNSDSVSESENARFLRQNWAELCKIKDYANHWVAVFGGKVVASASNLDAVSLMVRGQDIDREEALYAFLDTNW